MPEMMPEDYPLRARYRKRKDWLKAVEQWEQEERRAESRRRFKVQLLSTKTLRRCFSRRYSPD